MPGDDSADVGMTLDDLSEGAAIRVGQAELVPGGHPRAQGWVVHREQRRSLRRAGELVVEPSEPLGVEGAGVLTRASRVQDDQP